VSDLTTLANIGPAMARDLTRLGVSSVADLVGRDPVELYERLGAIDGRRHDPCVLDTFMSAVDQANGAPPRPWWTYTAERKRLHDQPGTRATAKIRRNGNQVVPSGRAG
jgi:Pathogenicity locus